MGRPDGSGRARSQLARGRRGDRAIFLLQGGEPLATLHLAAQKAGIASLPLSTRFGVDELAYCISDCSPVLIAVDETTHALVAQALETVERPPTLVWAGAAGNVPRGTASLAAEIDRARSGPVPFSPTEADISVMLYTSGTTGRPKGVPRTHRAEYHATARPPRADRARAPAR